MAEDTILPRKDTAPAVPHGTFNFWIDPSVEHDAFQSGIIRRWGTFRVGAETCLVCSEGPTLNAMLAVGTENERRLFRIPFFVSLLRRHLVTIGWSKGRMKVILDAKVIADIPVTFMLWFVFVSGVLLHH